MAERFERVKWETVLQYWFDPSHKAAWFKATPEIDAEIRSQFEPLWREVAQTAQLEEEGPEQALALVILLDQLPLNMFRDQAIRYSTADRAAKIARRAIDLEWDLQLGDEQKAFLYMPLMHSESLADQDLSVSCYEQAQLEENIRFARHHRDIVRRFGRFPHRNALLGRESTADERAWLASAEAFSA